MAFVALILTLALIHQTVRAQTPPPTPRPPNTATLDIENVRVIDGDTIEFWNDTIWGVGFIGVDAPSGNTACGEQATARLWELLGAGVHLEAETGFSLDARGRRWYHASTVDGRLVGEILIKEGLAKATSQTHKYTRLYKAAEQDASAAHRGCVWGGSAPARPQQPAAPGPSADPFAALPGGFVTDVVASGLTDPTAIAFLPDGRIFIAQKNGIVRLVKNGVLQPTPVIDVQDRVNDYWDHGLIGMTVNPNFGANPYVYLLYTYENNANDFEGPKSGRLARYTVTGDTAAPSSQLVLLGTAPGAGCATVTADCIPSESVTHSVGNVKVADDGTLFVTTGDAAAYTYVDDMALRAQNLDSLAGKLLHISATTGQGISTNPFWTGNASANKSKVYAYGMRNPYRFNLRPGSGAPYVGDVGWDQIEEVSAVLPGSNLGWPCYEGPQQQAGYASMAQCQALYAQGLGAVRMPIVSWLHSDDPCCSSAVTAGAFYTGTTYPAAYQGKYFYGDYAKSWLRYLQATDTNTLVAGSIGTLEPAGDGPVDVEMGPDENLYYVSIYTGQVRRIRYVGGGNHPPNAVAVANKMSGNAPLAVQFSSSGSYDSDADPLAYAWNFGDGATSTLLNPSHTYTTNGNYAATLTVTDGQGGSDVETIPISVGNGAPTATITSPAPGFTYKVGDTISFAGTASDPEQGMLGGAALSWTVVIHHCPGGGLCHTHTFLTKVGAGDNFVVPDHGNDFYFEFILTATDSGGLTGTTSVSVFPQTVPLTVNSDPPGLQLIFDGQIANGPITRNSVIGSVHSIEAVTPQGENLFTVWSDGQPQFHYIVTPAMASSVIATYSGPTTITFDDVPGQADALAGEYPTGVIDWGSTNKWLHSLPWLAFNTRSLTFYGPGINSASFSFVTPRRLLRLDMFNGGPTSSTVTIACAGQPTKTQVLASAQILLSVATGWTATCTPVTISSTNGWDTNFDNLVYDSGGAPPPNQQPSVNAGPDLNVTLPASAALDAAVTDDGLPAPPNLTTAWTKQSGPDSVAFTNAASVDTTATFSQAGAYVLRLTASDGALSSFDDVSVNVQAANTPPTVANAAAATPNPTSGTTTQLSVLGADDGGEAALIYTWSVTGSPPGAVTFSPNTTNASKNTTATFTRAGTYALRATIRDASNQTVTSDVSVLVNQTFGSIIVAPLSTSVPAGTTKQYTAQAIDQFGIAMATQPVFTWSVSGGGSINAGGLFTAGATAGGPFTVTATSGAISGTATLSVTSAGGLVAAYGFNEASGKTANDSSGQGNNGTLSGPSRTSTSNGKYGRALSFDGVNDQVNVNDSNSLDLTDGMTLEAWVRPAASGGWRTILLKEQTAGLVYSLYGNTSLNKPSGELATAAGGFATDGAAALALNTWTHLATTYDGTTLRLYVNGALVSSQTVGGAIKVSTGKLRIGGNAIWGEFYTGRIDEVRIYSRALTAAEISTDMNTPLP